MRSDLLDGMFVWEECQSEKEPFVQRLAHSQSKTGSQGASRTTAHYAADSVESQSMAAYAADSVVS